LRLPSAGVGASLNPDSKWKSRFRAIRRSSDTGLYLFGLVDPGTYSVTVEAAGFAKFIQESPTGGKRV
jgi:hypothetical protein